MSDKNIDNETKELIDSFIAESNDLLDDVEVKIGTLEKEDNNESINTVFRAFHSIKGTAGYLNFKNIASVTHIAETLLDIFRKENIKPSHIEIDILYLTSDVLRKLMEYVQREFNDNAYNGDLQIVTESIQKLIDHYKNKKEAKNEKINDKEEKKDEKLEGKKKSKKEKSAKKNEFEELVTDEIIEKFISESNSLLEKTEEDILKLEKNPENQELISGIFRNIHTIKGNAGFIGNERIEKECRELESFLEKLRSKENKVTNNIISFFLNQLDLIGKLINSILSAENNTEETEPEEEYKPLGEILVEMGTVTEETLDKALDLQNSKIGKILVDTGSASEADIKKALEKQNQISPEASTDASLFAKRSDVRVSTQKLDKLFELAGEIATAQAMVINSPDIEGMDLPRFEKAANYLTKITREMQEVAMTIRLIPLEGVFTKTIRLVRDLSRKANKKVELKISGEDTEMDRKITEELSDPLVHLIRNAIDHGIEEKEERAKTGKDETAIIKLDAKYEGNEIWITITDDGRGLNREKIIKKAIERGLLTTEHGNLKDEEVWQFIFNAGLSTAEKVTDISGRGVGMDVVKKNIDKLKGKITVHSVSGKGTEVILKIPLTVAILDVITVKVSNNIYSIPTVDILEFLQPKDDQITKLANKKELIKIREDIVPIVKLYEFYKIANTMTKLTEGVLVVVEREKKKAALLIDTILGSQQVVIKPLSSSFRESRGISGCSILGNGELSLIIDTGRLIEETLE